MQTFSTDDTKDISVMISIDENKMLTGHKDGTIRLWSISKGSSDNYHFEMKCEFVKHTKEVRYLILGHGRFIAVSLDHTLSIWDLSTNNCEKVIEWEDKTAKVSFSGATSITLLSDNLLAVGGYCSQAWGCVDIYDLKAGKCLFGGLGMHHRPGAMLLTTVKGYLVVHPEFGGNLTVWKISPTECKQVSEAHAKRIYSLAATSTEDIITGGFGLSLYTVMETGKVVPSETLPYWNDNVIDTVIPLANTEVALTVSRKGYCAGTIELKDYVAQTSQVLGNSITASSAFDKSIVAFNPIAHHHIFSPGHQLIIAADETKLCFTPLPSSWGPFTPVATPLYIS